MCHTINTVINQKYALIIYPDGAQWLSGRVLDSRPKGPRFKPHQGHCIVSLCYINPSLVRVRPRKSGPFITERFLPCADFFQKKYFRNFFIEILSECQTVWIQIRPDILSGLIWIQTVCKGCHRKTLAGKELTTK